MNTAAIKKTAITRELAFVPESQLDRVQEYIASILSESGASAPRRRSLKGIWRSKGFERIRDLEAEIRQARTQLSDAILRRKV